MTLLQMKKKTLALIEEINAESPYLTDDIDIQAKINFVINQVQNELVRIKKLPAMVEIEVEADEEMALADIDENIFQLNAVKNIDAEIVGDWITFKSAGTAKIFYYVYPQQIDDETLDAHVFELPIELLEIMPYGIAGDLLKSDASSDYGSIYMQRYNELMQRIDPRLNMGSIFIETDSVGGGIL